MPNQGRPSYKSRIKIIPAELDEMLAAGKSHQEAADHFGVTKSAISNHLDRRKINSKQLAAQKADEHIDRGLKTIDQLRRINERSNKILDELTGDEKTMSHIVEAASTALAFKENKDPQAMYSFIDGFASKMLQDKQTALKACAEIRGQLKLQLEIYESLFNMKSVQKFIETVIEVVGDVSPEARNAIIRRLDARSAIRKSIDWTPKRVH